MKLEHPVISADSHISEVEASFEQIDPAFKDMRPRAIFDEHAGAVLTIADLDIKVPIGLLCTGGRPPEDFARAIPWEEIHPAGYEPKARLAIQDEEGISAEIIYPSLGMVLCNHPNIDYKKACFDAYNRWLQGFCEPAPQRLVGIPIVTLRNVEEGIEELRQCKEADFKGVMLPGNPSMEDYDHYCYDPFWQACVDLELPVSFHILTTKDGIMERTRGRSRLVQQIVTVRGIQNIVLMMILGGVFDRHPKLKVVCVEADAGWVPHFKFRMDHAYERHRFHLHTKTLERMPGDYFDDNIYVTFQDDYSIKHIKGGLNLKRVMWATDFPHSDGTYPNTEKVMHDITSTMSNAEKKDVLYANVADLYAL